jgi:hypothetical protein
MNELLEGVKKAIGEELKAFELKEGIRLSLRLKKERWDFISELMEFLNKSTTSPVKGYNLMVNISLPIPSSGDLLIVQFFVSSDSYDVSEPYFIDYMKDEKAILIIEPYFSLDSAKVKYDEFVRQKGLAKENESLWEIVFTLEENEYELFEYLV